VSAATLAAPTADALAREHPEFRGWLDLLAAVREEAGSATWADATPDVAVTAPLPVTVTAPPSWLLPPVVVIAPSRMMPPVSAVLPSACVPPMAASAPPLPLSMVPVPAHSWRPGVNAS